jgi:undecaprenyl phosphate N,N'-diacetylbacillosamine 1-phosphate transferase
MLTAPVFFMIMLFLVLANKGSVWFLQKRPGYRENIFTLVKFKTMSNAVDANGNLLPDDKRLTKFGKLIRQTSLDELPQLLNVLKGDMSFVGPRPLLIQYLPLYNARQKRRHEVKPGITGWAQINGRNSITWEQKFEYDLWYVDHISFWLDFQILVLTFVKVFKREGISSATHVTMEKFNGNTPDNSVT